MIAAMMGAAIGLGDIWRFPFFGVLAIIAVCYFMGNRGFDEMNKNARVKLSHTWLKP